MQLYWPILLAVASNTIYHICTKSTPSKVDPLASLILTYLMAAAMTLVLYLFLSSKDSTLIQEFQAANWSAYLLGAALVGLEVGTIYMYKVGWPINTGFMLQGGLLAFALLTIGYFVYQEPITLNKLLGLGLCLAGMLFLNK